MPLVVQTTAERLHADACGYWAALAFSTGFTVRQRLDSEPAWVATLELDGDTLAVRLLNPQGDLRATKSMPIVEPCAEAIEILSILLAAHVPAFDVEPAQPEVPPPPDERDREADLPVATQEVGEPSSLALELTLASAVVLLTDRARAVAALGLRLYWEGLLVGLEVGGGYHRRAVGSGSLTVSEIGPRLVFGFAPHDGDRLNLRFGGSAGARMFRGTTRGLAETGSDDIFAAELGAFAEAAWRLTTALSLYGGVAVRRLLPRPAFAVTGRGQVFRTPVASLQISVGLAWGSKL